MNPLRFLEKKLTQQMECSVRLVEGISECQREE
jgi:hypothetical protein